AGAHFFTKRIGVEIPGERTEKNKEDCSNCEQTPDPAPLFFGRRRPRCKGVSRGRHGVAPAAGGGGPVSLFSICACARRVFSQLFRSSSMRCSIRTCSILPETSSSLGSGALRLRTSGRSFSW